MNLGIATPPWQRTRGERRQAHRPRKSSQQPNHSPLPPFPAGKAKHNQAPTHKTAPPPNHPQPTVPFAGTWTHVRKYGSGARISLARSRGRARDQPLIRYRLSHESQNPFSSARTWNGKKRGGRGEVVSTPINQSIIPPPPKSYKKRERDRNSALPSQPCKSKQNNTPKENRRTRTTRKGTYLHPHNIC